MFIYIFCPGNPINSLFVAPAVTPVKGASQKQTNNPGIRLFRYDPCDYKLLVSWHNVRIDPILMPFFSFHYFNEMFSVQLCELYFMLKNLMSFFYVWTVSTF